MPLISEKLQFYKTKKKNIYTETSEYVLITRKMSQYFLYISLCPELCDIINNHGSGSWNLIIAVIY